MDGWLDGWMDRQILLQKKVVEFVVFILLNGGEEFIT